MVTLWGTQRFCTVPERDVDVRIGHVTSPASGRGDEESGRERYNAIVTVLLSV